MSEAKKQVAAIYVRVSTEEQAADGLSIPAQVHTLMQYCQAFGITIYKVYEDAGLSGKDTISRPALNSLVADSYKSLFNMVLVWKISRLSRSLKDLLYLIDIFEKNNIVFSSYSEKFDTSTPVGRMTLQLLGSIAEFERNTIVENVRLGLREYARRGGKTGSVLGYRQVNKNPEIVENEAEAVRLIFDLYVNTGMSLSGIAARLNAMGYRTKHGKLFRSDSIALILDNPVYIGINRHHLDSEAFYEVKGTQTPIISEALWTAAQNKRNSKHKKNAIKIVKGLSMLTALIRCPCCGEFLTIYYTAAKGRKYRYYRCSRHTGKAFHISSDSVENTALDYMKAVLADPTVITDLKRAARNRLEYDSGNYKKDIDNARKEKEYLHSLLERYIYLLENELIYNSETITVRVRDLTNKIKELESRIEVLAVHEGASSNHAIQDFETALEQFTEMLPITDPGSLNELMSTFIAGIVPDKNKKTFEFSFLFPICFEQVP